MSAEQADQLIQGYELTADLEPFVQNRGEELAVGLERASAFLQSASREAGRLQHVYCCGGGARIPGLTDVLARRLKLPVDVATPLQRLQTRDGVFDTINPDEVGPLLMLATGLALRRN
jgi:type IV pilus assembly protein PilM